MGLKSTDGEVDRNSETQFLVSDLINTQRLNELRLSTDGLNYCSNFAQLLNEYRIKRKSFYLVLIERYKFDSFKEVTQYSIKDRK